LKKAKNNITNGYKELEEKLRILSFLKENLEREIPISKLKFSREEEKQKIKEYNLLTAKPFIVVVNYNGEEEKEFAVFEKCAKEKNIPFFSLSVKLEKEIQKMSPEEMEELALHSFNFYPFFEKIKELLKLKSFFTAGKKETKSWLIKKEANARQCAEMIHSSIAKGFIKAEVCSYNE